MTADEFRDIALSLEGAIERSHMGHPDFRANGRIFATLQANDEWGMVKVAPQEQAELLRLHPAMFTPAAGAWGRQGCTLVQLAVADPATIRGAMLLAWELSAAAPPPRKSSRKASSPKVRTPTRTRR
jgi:hypothetical protein